MVSGHYPRTIEREPMTPRKTRRRRLAALAAAALPLGLITGLAATAGPASATPAAGIPYHLAKTFHVPVPADAIANGWCYDGATVDPRTHLMYLSDGANKQITVINPRTGSVAGIGTGLFTGIGACHQFDYDRQGPNGITLYRGRVFAGNGDSHVLGFSLKTGDEVADINTLGDLRADEMTVAPSGGTHYLAVDNPAESPHPYMSFINLDSGRYQIAARFTFTQATGGLEQPRYWRGHLYVSVPQTTASPNGGAVDELDISNLASIRIIRQFDFATCQPAGLAIRADGRAAVGCGGPANTSQEILNLRTGQQTPVPGVPGVDIVAVNGPDFFFVSYGLPATVIADSAGTILQKFPATGVSHTVAVDPSDGDAFVPEDKGTVSLYSPGG
jgi:hypothetical protein